MKKVFYSIFITVLSLYFINSTVFATDDMYLTSDYKNTYIKYNESLSTSLNVENYLNMCNITFTLNDFNSAKQYCKAALKEIEKEKNPNYELKSDVLAAMGELYLAANNNSDIIFDYLNRAKEYKENNPETDKYNLAKLYKNIASAYKKDKNDYLSKKYWDKAINTIKDEPSEKYKALNAVIYYDMAIFEKENKNFEKSKEYLDIALKNSLEANNYENYLVTSNIYGALAEYYKTSKKDKKSEIKYSQKSAEVSAKFPDKTLLTKEHEDDDKTSIQDIKDMLDKYPYDIDLNVMAGSYYIPSKPKDSEQYFEKAISVNPTNGFLYAAIANSYSNKYKEANFKEYQNNAKKYALLAEKYLNYEPDIYLTLGVVYLNLKLAVVANMYFNEYIKYSEDKATAYCEIATIFSFEGEKFAKYVVYYLEKAKKINELNSNYNIMLINAYKQTGKTKKADNLATKLFKDEAFFEEN